MTKPAPVVACSLPEPDQRRRREEIRRGIAQRVVETRDLADGLALRFPLTEGDEAEVRAFVAFESGCCGFARFFVRRETAAGALWLEIRGPEGTADFARQLVADAG